MKACSQNPLLFIDKASQNLQPTVIRGRIAGQHRIVDRPNSLVGQIVHDPRERGSTAVHQSRKAILLHLMKAARELLVEQQSHQQDRQGANKAEAKQQAKHQTIGH